MAKAGNSPPEVPRRPPSRRPARAQLRDTCFISTKLVVPDRSNHEPKDTCFIYRYPFPYTSPVTRSRIRSRSSTKGHLFYLRLNLPGSAGILPALPPFFVLFPRYPFPYTSHVSRSRIRVSNQGTLV